MTAGCNDCHTAGYGPAEGNVPEAEWLKGDALGWRGPWGTTYAANLRLRLDEMTEDEWVEYAKTFKTRPPMPWFNVNTMTETDLRSIHKYVPHLRGPRRAGAGIRPARPGAEGPSSSSPRRRNSASRRTARERMPLNLEGGCRCGAVQLLRRQPHALSLPALLLLDLPQDRGRRRLRHQPHGDAATLRSRASARSASTAPRSKARRPLRDEQRRAEFLPALRQRALAVRPGLAGPRPSVRLGHRHRAADARRSACT